MLAVQLQLAAGEQKQKDEQGRIYQRSEIVEKIRNRTSDVFTKDRLDHTIPVRIYKDRWLRTVRDDDCDNLDNLPPF